MSPQESAHESIHTPTPETQYVVRLWLHGEYVGGLYGVTEFDESPYSLTTNTGAKGSMSILYKTTGFSWVIEEFRP